MWFFVFVESQEGLKPVFINDVLPYLDRHICRISRRVETLSRPRQLDIAEQRFVVSQEGLKQQGGVAQNRKGEDNE